MKSQSLIKNISNKKQSKRGWVVEVNGKKIKEVSRVRIYSDFGELNYGETPGGYDSWSFHEAGGGGVVSVPFSIIDGKLYVGAVLQDRPNQGGKIWNLPRGFLDPGENNFQALEREFEEEVRWLSPDRRVKPLEGEEGNPNSTFFETHLDGEGVKFYSIDILPSQLKKESSEEDIYVFKKDAIKPISKSAEQIFKCKFFLWRRLAYAGDMFTLSGIARLLATQMIVS